MKLFPVMLNLAGKNAAVIGGGSVALRKVRDLISCGAMVTVIAPEIHSEIRDLSASRNGQVTLLQRKYQRGDIDGSLLVYSATDDESVNREIYSEAAGKNILVNAVDDPPNCSFYMPSWFERNGLVVAVSTSGISPSLSARIRKDIEKNIPDSIDAALPALQQARTFLRENEEFSDLSTERRGMLLKRIVLDDDLLDKLVDSFKNDSVKEFLIQLKSSPGPG